MSNSRNVVTRSMHDVGLAAWFGGSLMGAVGLNGAAGDASRPGDPARIAASGWARWSPVAAAAIGTHVVGGLAVLRANQRRVLAQQGVTANTAVKILLTAAAIGSTAYSGVLGARIAKEGQVPSESATVPAETTPREVASAQRQLRVLQWVTPALTGVLIVLAAQQGEQQRATEILKGTGRRIVSRLR